MSTDWETHRILTRGGKFRALVFTLSSGRLQVRTPIDLAAARVSFFDSMPELEAMVQKRRWRLERVRHFS